MLTAEPVDTLDASYVLGNGASTDPSHACV